MMNNDYRQQPYYVPYVAHLEPGKVMPPPNGGDGNPFNAIIVLVIAAAIGMHISEGNVNPQPRQQPQYERTT